MEQKKAGKKTSSRTGKASVRPSRSGRSAFSKKKKTKKDRVRERNFHVFLFLAGVFVVCCISGFFLYRVYRERELQEWQRVVSEQENGSGAEQWQREGAPYIDVQLLTPNEYSRPQIPIDQIKYIAIHYTANPGAGAMDNRNYFENLAATHETKVSSHFVVGLNGEVVQCIPTSEMSYATNERNVDTLSIECCHTDETGVFNEATYDSVVKLTAWLCTRFGLTEENVIRHYDVTGKNCPKYYVENQEAWEQMKADIAAQIQEDYILQENL